MLAIDTAFLILELGVGVAVGSLALMADAFHMVCGKLEEAIIVADSCAVERYHITRCRIMGCQSCAEVVNR